MSSSVGLLEFFILEASDYVEHLDELLARSGAGGPETDDFTRYARMLRGSATMARQPVVADVAGAVERVGRALREGTLLWEPGIQSVLTAAVDDLKILIRGVRTWGPGETHRAEARIVELSRYAPVSARTPTPTPSGGSGMMFLIEEASQIATALEAFAARPSDRGALDAALGRVRALRGVAAIRDLPPLPDVIDGIERAAKPLELGTDAAAMPQLALFDAAAQLLRRLATDLRQGRRPDANAPDVHRFAAAAAELVDSEREADRIVPIGELFFDDGGPALVSESPTPPTTLTERFRLEVVSQAEHLRRLVADAHQAHDAASRTRLARELQGALHALRSAADSFGEHEVAAFVAASGDAVTSLDALALGALDEVAALLTDPSAEPAELSRRLTTLGQGRSATGLVNAFERAQATDAWSTTSSATGEGREVSGAQGRPAARSRTPTGRALQAMLQTGISGIGALSARPLSKPVPLVDPTLVPIEALLYRGRAALERALELREQLRTHQGPPPQEALDELYDLLELANAE